MVAWLLLCVVRCSLLFVDGCSCVSGCCVLFVVCCRLMIGDYCCSFVFVVCCLVLHVA